jgi:dTDP-4-amino-4,6-dideoxygalactose transaminase
MTAQQKYVEPTGDQRAGFKRGDGFVLIRIRRRIAQRYSELLASTPLRLPREPNYAESVWHLYVIRHPRRDELKRHLEANQIGCAIHYPLPLHLQKCYAELGHREGDFPQAERAAREVLALPMFPELTEEQILRVAEVVKEFFVCIRY